MTFFLPFSSKRAHAVAGSAETAEFVLFRVEVVVVRQFFACSDGVLRADYDVLLAVNCNDLGAAVGVAAVVEVPGLPAEEGGVDDLVLVEPEHVAVTNSSFFISFLTVVSNLVADDLTHVLDDDVLGLQVLLRE